MKKKVIKKKKTAKKTLGHNQVPRPSHKKPRPKKYVEPKLPNTDKLPEAIDASVAEDYIADILSEPELRSTLEKLNYALDQAEENVKIYTDEFKTDTEAKLEQPIKVEIELPPGKTEQEVVQSINIASNLMKNQYDAAIDEIRTIWGRDYNSKGNDGFRDSFNERTDLIDNSLRPFGMRKFDGGGLSVNYETDEIKSVQEKNITEKKLGIFERLTKWLWG